MSGKPLTSSVLSDLINEIEDQTLERGHKLGKWTRHYKDDCLHEASVRCDACSHGLAITGHGEVVDLFKLRSTRCRPRRGGL